MVLREGGKDPARSQRGLHSLLLSMEAEPVLKQAHAQAQAKAKAQTQEQEGVRNWTMQTLS